MGTSSTRTGLGVVGAGAAACAACRAGPILGFLAATGIASTLGAVIFGLAGIIAVVAISAALWHRRRRQQTQCGAPTEPAEPVAVAAPQLRAHH